jgi:hypothetical protein
LLIWLTEGILPLSWEAAMDGFKEIMVNGNTAT